MSNQTPEALQLVKQLVQQPGNNICADCQREPSKWASSTLGIFICYNCSGIHRALGTHITLVRSCTLDGWTPQQAKVMKRVGNKVANEYWEANLPADFMRPLPTDRYNMERFIRDKYERKLWAGDGEPPHLRKPGFARPIGNPQPYPQLPIQQAPASEPPVQIHYVPQQEISSQPQSILQPTEQKPVQQPKPKPEKKQASFKKFAKPLHPSQSESLENLQNQDPQQQLPTTDPEPGQEPVEQQQNPEQPHLLEFCGPKKQSLFKKKAKGPARFMKKPVGEAVIDQMISSPESRPMTAPVQPNKNAALSLFAGMNIYPNKN